MNNEITEKYFDDLAQSEGVNENNNIDKYNIIKKRLAPQTTHPRILECGGGAGFYTRRFLQEGFEVTCIDLSDQALKENRERAKHLSLSQKLTTIQGTFTEKAKQLERHFDQVAFIKVFHHFESLKDIQEALDVAIETCKPGGKIIIFEPNGKNFLWWFFLSLTKAKGSNHSKWYFEKNMRFTTAPNFKKYLDKKNQDYELKYHYVIPATMLKKTTSLSKVLKKINQLLENTPLRYLSFNISIVIDVK